MIEAKFLIKDRCYFLVWYYDDDLLVPDIETYFYLGKNLLEDGSVADSFFYFQEAEEYVKNGAFNFQSNENGEEVLRADIDTLDMIYDDLGLAQLLLEIQKNKPA